MSRTREFNPEAVLDAALDLFWRKGYKSCSMAEVVKRTGVARYGLYQVFKDKDHLYCETLKRYRDQVKAKVFTPLRENEQQLDFNTLKTHFELVLQELENGMHDGCFAHQAAIERASKDSNVNQVVQEIFNEVKNTYRLIIVRSIELGQIRKLPVEDLVNYVIGIQRAVIAMSKQKCPFDELKSYVWCSLKLLETENTKV